MSHNQNGKDQMMASREEYIEDLEIQLKHLRNDLRITKEEYETTTSKYFEIYTKMEQLVQERTQELEKSRETLEQKGKELQIMLDSSPALIYFKDTGHRFIRVNKMFADIVGLSSDQIIGKEYAELFPENTDHGYEAEVKVIEEERAVLNRMELLETADGFRELQIDRIPHKNSQGEVIGIIGFALDITDLKRAESARKELEEQLSQAQKLESIGVLAGGIAHDFNNVMAIVSGAAQMLELKVTDSSLQPYIDMITSSITRGKSITDRLLTFSRSDPMEFQILSGNKALENTFEIVTHTLSKDIDVHVVPYEENDLINGDPAYLQQVLLNICINAADAMPEGGDLTLKLCEPPEEMVKQYQTDAQREYLAITVTDEGTGIEPDTLDRIFEPFYTTKEPGKGTGLGLSVAYKIMQQHSGWIDVKSEVNEGTVVSLGIPKAPGTAKNGDTIRHVEKAFGNGEHILLVDDEESLRNLLQERLKINGYKVDVASNGEEALETCKQYDHNLDLVITDIKMPKIGGITLQKHLKDILPNTPTIAITGIVERDRLDDSGTTDFDAVLQKPLNISELLDTIRWVLQKRNVVN